MSTLEEAYIHSHGILSAFTGHLARLKELSSEVTSAVEMGVDNAVSTFAILAGLPVGGSLLSVDPACPMPERIELARILAEKEGKKFTFSQNKNFDIDIPSTDLLFIDTLHTYQQLITELRVYSGRTKKFIVMHDTSPPWGFENEGYYGSYTECPGADRTKKGLWPAVCDFLAENPNWKLKVKYDDWYGLTVLERVQ